jgi:tetratricopeptide (TPR) repeat protein
MIICSQCGSVVEDGMQFCSECGCNIPGASNPLPPPTIRDSAPGVAPARYYEPPPAHPSATTTPINPPPFTPPVAVNIGAQSATSANRTKALIALISLVAVVAIAVAVYLAIPPSPASRMAKAMKNAIANNQIVGPSNDTAYFYYGELKKLDPTHAALKEVGPQVLPQLRSISEDIFRRKVLTNSEKISDPDWLTAQRACEWTHDLFPRDKQLEARWQFASGEVAKLQKRFDDAERGFTAASQADTSWALPQNSLGLLRSETKRWREAIPYYERAINLQPDWEIPYNNLGTAFFYLQDFDTAQNWYLRAVQTNVNWARPHYWLGQIYQKRNWKAQAIEEYQKALQLDANNYSLTPTEADFIRRNVAKLQP